MRIFDFLLATRLLRGRLHLLVGCEIGDERGEWMIVGIDGHQIVIQEEANLRNVPVANFEDGTELLIPDGSALLATLEEAAKPERERKSKEAEFRRLCDDADFEKAIRESRRELLAMERAANREFLLSHSRRRD